MLNKFSYVLVLPKITGKLFFPHVREENKEKQTSKTTNLKLSS
jgi:hypothetical protein